MFEDLEEALRLKKPGPIVIVASTVPDQISQLNLILDEANETYPPVPPWSITDAKKFESSSQPGPNPPLIQIHAYNEKRCDPKLAYWISFTQCQNPLTDLITKTGEKKQLSFLMTYLLN